MTELLPVCIFTLLMAAIAEYTSTKKINNNGVEIYSKKNIVAFVVMALGIGIFCGLRTVYNDTETYRETYEVLTEASKFIFDGFKGSLGNNPGFAMLNSFMKANNVPTQSYLMFYALITNAIYIWFLRKYTDDMIYTTFLFIAMGCYTFTFAAVKQCFAVALCLIGTDWALRKKYIPFVIWVLLAITIHPYATMFLAVPFLTFKPWTRPTVGMILIFGTAGIFLQRIIGNIVSITTVLGENYDASCFIGEGVNIFRLALLWAPVILSLVGNKILSEVGNRESNTIINLMMLNAEIMFVALFGNPIYFARLANYFLIFQTLAVPWVINNMFTKKSAKLVKIVAGVGYTFFFIYENLIAHGAFDSLFDRITLTEYMKILFH